MSTVTSPDPIMCTETSCTSVRRYIFVPQRVKNIYCLGCINSFNPHLFEKVVENNVGLVCVTCNATCVGDGALEMFVMKTIISGTNSNKPAGCAICIKQYREKFIITQHYVDTSKLNNNQLCSFFDNETRRRCFKESTWFRILPVSGTSISSSSANTTTASPAKGEESYCSTCIDNINPSKKGKSF